MKFSTTMLQPVVLAALVLLARSAAWANELPVPEKGLYLGIYANPAFGQQETAIEKREGNGSRGIGRVFALHLGYYHWGDLAAELDDQGVFQPDTNLKGDIQYGRVPVISWKCDQSTPNSNHVIAGGNWSEDLTIFKSARALAQYPGPVIVRWLWEFNLLQSANYVGNQICLGGNGGEPTQQVYDDFIGAWRHIWLVFQLAGASNVVFLWNPGHYDPGMPNDPHGYYPGDLFVDWIGLDSYQRGTEDFSADIDQFYTDFTQPEYGGKPLMVGENGSPSYPQPGVTSEMQEPYLGTLLTAVEANLYPQLKAYCYFDSGDTPTSSGTDWHLDDNGGVAEMKIVGASQAFSPMAPRRSH